MTNLDSIKNITSLALALSILDGDVQTENPAKCERAGRRLSPSIFQGDEYDDLINESIRGNIMAYYKYLFKIRGIDKIAEILNGQDWPDELLPASPVNPDKPENLHEFLKGAVKMAISIGVDDAPNSLVEGGNNAAVGDPGAGAIYLHNPLHDELIMSASHGFPFVIENNKWPKAFKSAYDEDTKEFDRNHARLAYLRRELRKRIADKNIARHDWIRSTLRGNYLRDNEEISNVPVDCNDDLIGIAYYKPGSGITGQLFDKDEGPRLERTRLSEPNNKDSAISFATAFEAELGRFISNVTPFYKHLRHELLQKRTIVYKQRDDMGAGRQVKAGQYEPLQFPHPDFIGPFLGTVLRFNGEHLGILKIERHKFKKYEIIYNHNNNSSTVDQKKERKSAQDLWVNQKAGNFTGEQTAHFLLFSYALSGYLYLLKHHAGIDLSEGWTKSARK